MEHQIFSSSHLSYNISQRYLLTLCGEIDKEVVDGVVVINPGLVSKKASAGTFAKVYIAPKGQSSGMDMDEGGMKADVWERCRVDLHKI